MTNTAKLHLISGLPCAGKTTYAEQLAEKSGAVYLSLDHWLLTAFGRYQVNTIEHDEHVRRVYAIRGLIWEMTCELMARGAEVILDDGFFLRADRKQYIERASAMGVPTVTHFIDTDPDTIRRRLEARNLDPSDEHFEIAPDTLDAYIAFFERPDDSEGAEILRIRE